MNKKELQNFLDGMSSISVYIGLIETLLIIAKEENRLDECLNCVEKKDIEMVNQLNKRLIELRQDIEDKCTKIYAR